MILHTLMYYPVTQLNHTHEAVVCASHFLLGVPFALQGCKTPKRLLLNLNGKKEERCGVREQGCCCTVKNEVHYSFWEQVPSMHSSERSSKDSYLSNRKCNDDEKK